MKFYLFDDNKKSILGIILKIFLSLREINKFKFDVIILSPGINIDRCKLSNYLKKIQKIIYTDLDIFSSFYSNQCITITGTNGKSTTCQLLYQVLKAKI